MCRLEAPAGVRAQWHFLPCVWAVDSHILCRCQEGGEDGGRDASPRRPCWGCERLEGCKGWGDGSRGSQPGGLGTRVTLPRTGVGGTSAPLTPCLGTRVSSPQLSRALSRGMLQIHHTADRTPRSEATLACTTVPYALPRE